MKLSTIFPLMAAGTFILMIGCKKSNENVSDEVQTIDVAIPEIDSVVLYKTYPGVLSANREVTLVARVDGYLTGKLYTSGDLVEKGQVLFTIEDQTYRDAVAQAKAQLATAQTQYEYAATRYEALQKALQSDAVSKMEVEQGKSAKEEALAAINTAKATLQSALTTLSYCTVKAPFRGHISSAKYDVGTFLNGAASPAELAFLYEDEPMLANFAIEDASYIDMINQGIHQHLADFSNIPVHFSDSLPNKYTAALDYMAPSVDPSTGTMKMQATISNPRSELKSGMYVSIDLPYDVDPKALLIKTAAIGTDQLGSYVYVVNDSNKVVYTPIKTGQTVADTLTIVDSGLECDSRYVTKALLKVRDGMTVKPNIVK